MILWMISMICFLCSKVTLQHSLAQSLRLIFKVHNFHNTMYYTCLLRIIIKAQYCTICLICILRPLKQLIYLNRFCISAFWCDLRMYFHSDMKYAWIIILRRTLNISISIIFGYSSLKTFMIIMRLEKT